MAKKSIEYYFREYSETSVKPEVEITSTYRCGVTETSGIDSYGEVKSIYTESYAEESSLKVYSAPKVARKLPEMKINIAFIGSAFQTDYDNLVQLLSGNKYEYRDTLRNKKCFVILSKEVKTESENPTDYLQAEFTFMQFKEPVKV